MSMAPSPQAVVVEGAEGNEAARQVARKTMEEVRQAMSMDFR